MRGALLWITLGALAGCGRIGFDALEPDAAAPGRDAGRDAAPPEAGPPEAGAMDGALADTGVDTGRPMDAGMDAGRDTGPPPGDAGDDDDAGPPPPPCAVLPAPIDHCLSVPHLGGPPLMDGMLDGVVDCAPPLGTFPPVGWSSAEPLPPGNSARYAMGYREDGVYVYVEVTDPDRLPAPPADPPWRGDSVEVYLDSDGLYAGAPTYDDPGAAQFVIAAPVDDVTPSSRATRYRNAVDLGAWGSSRFATFPTPGGYVLEAWFSASDLGLSDWTLATAGHIGFNISINVSPAPADLATLPVQGTRLGQYFLHTGGAFCGSPFCSPDAFCSPELLAP